MSDVFKVLILLYNLFLIRIFALTLAYVITLLFESFNYFLVIFTNVGQRSF